VSPRAATAAVAGIAAALGLALGACGVPSPDLFVVERAGAIPGARLTMVVSDGGFVRCNGGEERPITSAQLIEAREIARALNGEEEEPGPARRNVALPPGPGAILRYDVRLEYGEVAFSDTSRGQPPAFFRVAKLTRDLARSACGLRR
jgi:hypothetical protein